ncbi:MAG: RecX family transcriptional regulator [Treponema sp.]|nr:RecX family transcriptional regulator [Treponema sp.]
MVTTSKTRAGIIRIGLSDGALFSLNPFYLPRHFQGGDYFFPGKELSAEEAGALCFAAGCYRAERAALRLAARAEQTCAGLRGKLEIRGHDAAHAQAAVAYLRELGIVDDRRFAERWIRSRLYRGADSPLRLINGLCRRGIDRNIAREARLTALDFDLEIELLGKFIAKKHPAAVPGNGDARFLRALLKSEGFSPSVLERYWDEQ